jgi:hypothetical protein
MSIEHRVNNDLRCVSTIDLDVGVRNVRLFFSFFAAGSQPVNVR